ncbi:MAG TPA: hypothetical protein DCP07_02015 [Lachnospiraceae bacterium]|nr:hypothetical protein [Lachnospiraceae bacterium]
MKEKHSGVFFIVLIASVLIVILLVVFFAKRDLDEVQETQSQISVGEEKAQDLEEGVNMYNDADQQRFDNLDQELNY